MARKIAAGNWKMNGLTADLSALKAISDAAMQANCGVVICPPAPLLASAVQQSGTALSIGAQDCHAETSGAHTGDTSASLIADIGANYVIIGHSERRTDHGETDAEIAAKLVAVQAAGLTPILCLGESLETRQEGAALSHITAQFNAACGPRLTSNLVIAYEPIWAIGTGVVATTTEIAEVHAALRSLSSTRFGPDVPLLYGGSVKANNAAEIFAVPDVDGALVGGASLKAADFVPIIQALSAS